MKATIQPQGRSNAKQLDKEIIKQFHVIGLFDGQMREIIDCRLYMSRSGDGASPVYCSIWVFGKQGSSFHTSGRGRANGYGYHKGSAAICEALDSAGIKLDRDISGVGDSAVEDAFRAIAEALGAKQVLIVS